MEQRFLIFIFIITASYTAYLHGEESMSKINQDYATKKYSIIPPAPEVASLMKYIDVPVSHFTGHHKFIDKILYVDFFVADML